ncbi:MAG TPA: ScyD/ScyE family protein [Mycobacteriales bacterium]|jgi:hypothetical protein|nr:ScyD/ScyE family protein [Mycobacteriales bacterium]
MKIRLLLSVTAGLSALLCSATAPTANAAGPVTTVVSGLTGPLNVSTYGGKLYIADAFAGQVVRADPATGSKTVLATKINANGVSVGLGGRVVAAIGEGGGATPGLARIAPGGTPVQIADLLAFEKRQNPDGQRQGTGPRADALSNPYDVLVQPNRTLVADAAGNDILSVARDGSVRALTVLPVSKKGSCATTPNNGVPNGGCDSVPTGMAVGADGYLYVSGLGGEVEGHVWKIEQSSGRIVQEFAGLPPLTGIAAGPGGNLFVSSLFTNTIYRLGPDGKVTGTVSVPGPTGLEVLSGKLYAGSVVMADGGPPVGSIVRVSTSAFSAG